MDRNRSDSPVSWHNRLIKEHRIQVGNHPCRPSTIRTRRAINRQAISRRKQTTTRRTRFRKSDGSLHHHHNRHSRKVRLSIDRLSRREIRGCVCVLGGGNFQQSPYPPQGNPYANSNPPGAFPGSQQQPPAGPPAG